MRDLLFCCLLSFSSFGVAQQEAVTNSVAPSVLPRLVRFGGIVSNADGNPRTGRVGLSFSLYAEQQRGVPLWQEVQNVTLDVQGHYSVLLGAGSADGLPLDLFSSNEARWLGVQVEQEAEQARILLVAVPYALKAADAETLGGKPASAYVLNDINSSTTTSSSGAKAATTALSTPLPLAGSLTVTTNGGTANYIPKWLDGVTLSGTSQVFDDGTNVGIGTVTPGAKLDISGGFSVARFQGNSTDAVMTFRNTATGGGSWDMVSTATGSSAGAGRFSIAKTGVAHYFTIDTNGNVGISNISPSARLDISGDFSVARFGGNSTDAVMTFANAAAGGGSWDMVATATGSSAGAGKFSIAKTGVAHYFTIDTNGNVGLSNTAPTATLEVGGNVKVDSGGITFPDNSTQTTAAVGTITGVTVAPGSGLTGGGTSGSVSLAVDSSVARTNASNSFVGPQSVAGNLAVAGNVAITGTGNGITFPDNTVQTTAPTAGNNSISATTSLSSLSVASGSCTVVGATVTGATTSMVAIVSPVGDPSNLGLNSVTWNAFVDTANHVSIQFCHFGKSSAILAGTLTLNIRVIK